MLFISYNLSYNINCKWIMEWKSLFWSKVGQIIFSCRPSWILKSGFLRPNNWGFLHERDRVRQRANIPGDLRHSWPGILLPFQLWQELSTLYCAVRDPWHPNLGNACNSTIHPCQSLWGTRLWSTLFPLFRQWPMFCSRMASKPRIYSDLF